MKFVLVPKKCIVFELSRKVEPIETFEEIGIKFFAFDRNIYFDSKTRKGTSKFDKSFPRYYFWFELKEGYLTYCRSFPADTNHFKKWLNDGNGTENPDMIKSIFDKYFLEIAPILDDVEGYNLKIQQEIDQEKTEMEKEDLEKEKLKQEKEEQEKKAFEDYILKSEENLKNGKKIEADAFEELLKRNGIKIPLRTLGWIRGNLLRIGTEGWNFRGGKSATISKLLKELERNLMRQN